MQAKSISKKANAIKQNVPKIKCKQAKYPSPCLDNTFHSMRKYEDMKRLKRGNRIMQKLTKKKKRKENKGKAQEPWVNSSYFTSPARP